MSNSHEQPEKTAIERIRESIGNASNRIDAEFSRTDNSWMNCFATRILHLEALLELAERQSELSEEESKVIRQKFRTLHERYRQLDTQYPTRDTTPPEEIKQELLRGLDIMG